MDFKELKLISIEARKKIIDMKYNSKSSHIGSAFSVLDILIFLFFNKLNINSENINDEERDRLILSKGHASAALYVTLAKKGLLSEKKLDKFYCDNGELPGHIDHTVSNGLDASTGSLGHGLSIGAGMAMASYLDKIDNNIVVILGDGEVNEGSIWESAMFISRFKLSNLLIIIDSNKLQGYDRANKILKHRKMINMWKALDFDVEEINGHSFVEMEEAINNFSYKTPKVIIANTVKGKGVSFMEDKLEWHYKSPNKNESIVAKNELEKEKKELVEEGGK